MMDEIWQHKLPWTEPIDPRKPYKVIRERRQRRYIPAYGLLVKHVVSQKNHIQKKYRGAVDVWVLICKAPRDLKPK